MPRAADCDVAIIGAGCAGLGAARELRDSGLSAIVLEAAGRVGGRAWTAYPPELGGVWFDMGAVWLHDAEHNPLVPIARAAGEHLMDADDLRREQSFIGNRNLTPDEFAQYDGAWDRFEAAAARLIGPEKPDVSLAEVARSIPEDPWAVTVECWEGPVIDAADAASISLIDWQRNALSGANLVPDGGIGAFIARCLPAGLDVRLNTPATRLLWGGRGGRVTVETPRGTLTARSAIVTVSTGVLAACSIRFDPALPPAWQEAIAALPMGLAVKIALRATSDDRLGLPLHCSLDRRAEQSGEPFMVFQCWPFKRDYVQGWIGGTPARDLARAGEAACADFALCELRRILGGRVDRVFAGGARLMTRWDADPLARGVYAYAPPGEAGARLLLAEPLPDGHLLFAGEACHDGFAGTVGGAWLSGKQAARTARRSLEE